MSKRAERRNQLNRMKRKAKLVYPDYHNAHTLANHLKNCSCQMCRNVRRSSFYNAWEKKTRQERLADYDQQDYACD